MNVGQIPDASCDTLTLKCAPSYMISYPLDHLPYMKYYRLMTKR